MLNIKPAGSSWGGSWGGWFVVGQGDQFLKRGVLGAGWGMFYGCKYALKGSVT